MDRKVLLENAISDIERRSSQRQVEAGEHLFKALQGDLRSKMFLQEGISTSDIPSLLAPSINVLFLAQFADYPVVWNQIAEEFTAPVSAIGGQSIEWGGFEFDTSNLLGDHDGDTYVGMGLPGVGEYDEYPAISFTTEDMEAALRKHGVRLRVSWESLHKLGNFDIISRATRAFARYAAEQEDVALAKAFVSPAGVANSGFGTVAGNPTLNIAGLEAAIAQGQAVTIGGRPLGASSWRLVTTPALGPTARNLLSITRIEESDGTFTYDRATNFGNVALTEFAALAQVGNYSTPGAVDDYWFLVGQGTARPAFLEIFADGYRTPLISIKDSGHFTLAGGAVPAREGNFEIDDVETRGRHVVSAFAATPEAVLFSAGTGSS